jgi:hypothetical protein
VNRAIVNLSIGDRYARMAPRLAESLRAVGESAVLKQWVDSYPPSVPPGHDLPIAAYCAKPYAMFEAWLKGSNVILWLDSACYAVKPLDPLWEQIERDGYYIQENGWNVGQWCSDAALKTLEIAREESFLIPECSSMVIGLDLRRADCRSFMYSWGRLAADKITFPGAHTNDNGKATELGVGYRNVGHVSDDPRVLGHRHDQTAASVLAHRLKWKMTPRPIFVDYFADPQDERTLIVNRGI